MAAKLNLQILGDHFGNVRNS